MNRALRIIVPMILAIALIACTAWYFLVYDQALTKELLLTQARNFEANGRHKLSAFLYDLAYIQSSQEDLVAIELAQQYLDIGNFTKAEYTLSQAIATNPTPELYIALCDVYVQQDKLMDAVNMLDTVHDLEIWSVLDALRPDAPAMSPEPGFYSTYLTLEIVEAPGTLYISTDGDYPSIEKDLYTDPITLSSGETVIYAIRIGENNLVSPLRIFGYTVGGVIEEVQFTDKAMEAAIRQAIGVSEDSQVYTDQLWDVASFVVPAEADSLEDLKYLPYVRDLVIPAESQGELVVLSALTCLESLRIEGRKLSTDDLSIIATRNTLKALYLPSCSVSSVTELASLTDLEVLDLSSNTIRNLTPLTGMTGLKELYLANNAINALDVVVNMPDLEILDVSYNSISNLSPVFTLRSSMHELYAANNQINSILGIADLQNLNILDLSFNVLSDVKMLTALTDLNQLNLSNNSIFSIDGLETMAHLRLLNVSYNQITALPAFPAGCELVSIDLSHNQVASLEPLAGLPWLNTVNADYNPDIEDLMPLDSCPVLIKVNVYGTKVIEVSFLTAKSIIVNFDPTINN